MDETWIERATPGGLFINGVEFKLDDLILAIGFDAMTGRLAKINIEGRDGLALRDAWAAGPRSYLGLRYTAFRISSPIQGL